MAQNLAFEAMFLRGVLERIQVRYRLSVDDLVSIFSLSPLFQYVAEPVLRVGLAAYLNGEFITAISTLTPQIEALVRSLVRIEEGRMYKPGKRGGLLVRTLDDLLRDEVIRQVLGDRTVKYLCVLLTDQRGWNFRNNVCHGLMASTAYDAHRADRVFHAIMLFAFIRLQPATTAETTDAIAAE
jgi:hypothetical protein